ncbi:hypothetical protein VT99_11961 [Candidatus Electrothrix marina]|uniref:DUF4435 domain-containing protein n=1 Tax=Candidatus Electrothrix marina TaxID=1859130 RepID=A0A3S4TB48_9BACT|nr:hypothetical protein VT99_11961 [Candidatus Electrothrix marina]
MTKKMLEIHKEARSNANTIYHEFLLTYKEGRKEVYGFVEGKEDPMFYIGLIENRLPHDWRIRLLRSGNKEKVLRTLGSFDWKRFDRKRICFFVDRDLSEFTVDTAIVDENLYITDGYSIENTVVTKDSFLRVVKEVYGVTELSEAEETKMLKDFNDNLRLFQEEMTPIMAQIIDWRKNSSTPCLDNIKLGEFFYFTGGKIHVKEPYRTVNARLKRVAEFVDEKMSDLEEVQNIEREFISKDGTLKFVRGKYLFWFFIENAKNVHENASYYCAKHTSPPKVKVAIGPKNAMTVVAPRARIPDTLAQFIDRNYLAYICQYK